MPIAMKFKNTCAIITGLLTLCFAAYAQVKELGLPEIRNYRPTDYEGGTQNWGIAQDKNDHLYFANNAGLFQFDGFNWNKFSLPNHPSVRSVSTTEGGTIYVGGHNEFGFFRPDAKGRLAYHSLLHLINENQRGKIDFIWKIHQFKHDVVFQSFERAYIYDGKTIAILDAPNRFQFSFKVDDKLFFQDKQLGLLEWTDGKLIELPGTGLLNDTEVWGMFALPGDTLLLTTQNRGLYVYANNSINQWKTAANEFLLKHGCLGGAVIREKSIVFNSVLDGLIVSDFQGRIIQHINEKKGLQNNTILSSFVDSKNNLWLGLDNGIGFINESSGLSYLGSSYNVSSVYGSVVHDKMMYVATNRGLFYRSWSTTFNDEQFRMVPGTTGQAWNIQVIDGQLLCSHNTGLLLIAGASVVRSIDAKGYWGVQPVAGESGISIGAHYNGFSIFENKNGGWKLRNHLNGFDKSSTVFETEGKMLWMTKDDVLYRGTMATDLSGFSSVKTYATIADAPKGAIGIHRLNGRIYFQTRNRFFTFDRETEKFSEDVTFTAMFRGMPHLRFLQQDNAGNLWYIDSESMGMMQLLSNGKYKSVVVPFLSLKGNLMTDYPSINTANAPDVFIGLTNGLGHFDMDMNGQAVAKPKAYIRSFSSPVDTLILGNSGAVMHPEPRIQYRYNNIKFGFSSPQYEHQERVEFSYRLAGFDTGWSSWTKINFKEYTTLHEGEYTMHVRARSGFGQVSETASISFKILPPFYRHPFAYVFYVLVAVGIFLLTRRQVRHKIRKNKYYETIEQRKLYLEKEARIKLEQDELEKEIDRLKMEKLKMSLLAKDKELLSNSLQVVQKNKILNSVIQKIKNVKDEAVDAATRLELTKLNKNISKELASDNGWSDLEKHIKNVHFDFLKRLKEKHPSISPRELDLATYLLLNMSSKEIAEIMNISFGGVELARYRLRKKLGLERSENLVGFLMQI